MMVMDKRHAGHDGQLAREAERVAACAAAVGDDAAENAADAAAQARHGRGKADLEDRHVARLREVKRKPGEKKPGERGDAVLADVNADQHAIAEKLLHRGPGERVLLHACCGVGIDQAAAALDGFDLRLRNARMLFDAVDVGEPDRGEHDSPARPETRSSCASRTT